jgi:hypothetical protein
VETLRAAWERACFGPTGRFTVGRRDFATALTDPVTAPLLCALLLARAEATDRALGEPADFAVVDVGAGTGAFLGFLAAHAPRRWALTGVERCPRPVGLDPRVGWQREVPEHRGLLLAHEWLDDVPLDVVRDGRTVLADGSLGDEHDPVWVARWGGTEDGSARDAAWSAATDRLTAGLALAVDYGHTRPTRRPTLTGWRNGRPVPPAFDGSCDVTAHVALDSLEGTLRWQHEVLAAVPAQVPAGDPATPQGLRRASALRALRDPDGYGGWGWVTLEKGLPSRA